MARDYPISKYRKLYKKPEATEANEVRVRVGSRPFSYAAYAGKQLLEKKAEFVYLNATGAAVSNAIKVIEYLKRHLKGLHVQYKILSKKFIDEYEPTIEGLDKVTTERIVSTLECTLTLTSGDKLKGTAGYIEPIPEAQVDQDKFEEALKGYQERKDRRAEEGDRDQGEGMSRSRRRGARRGGRGGRRPRRDDDRDDYRGERREDRGDRRRDDRDGERPPRRRDDDRDGVRPPRRDDRDGERPPRRRDDRDGERPPRRREDGERGGDRGTDRPPRRRDDDREGGRPPRRDDRDGERPPRRDDRDGDRPPRRNNDRGDRRPEGGPRRGGSRGGAPREY